MRRPPLRQSLFVVRPSPETWVVEKLVPGGAGFARLKSGQGGFVSGALPGEHLQVHEAEDHGGYLRATQWTLLEPSPERIIPACPVQSRCGGCDWMTLPYPAQLAAKAELLREALTRTGRFRALPELTFQSSPEAFGYRGRIRLHVSAQGEVGFFASASRELVEIPACLVAQPALNAGLLELRRVAREHPHDFGRIRELELKAAPGGPALALHLLPRSVTLLPSRVLLDRLASVFAVSVAGQDPAPALDQRFPLTEEVELRAPAGAFTQVNWDINRRLIEAVLDGAERRAVSRFCDLYCGAGNFSLPLFARGLSGVGIEAARASIAAAERAAKEQGLRQARFVAADVREGLDALPRSESFDLIVLDPPRSGAREIVPELLKRAPRYIAYCACDPVTLSRDLRALCEADYALSEISGFDMFPQTHHFETLVWLTHV